MDKLLKNNSYKSIIIIFHNEKERIKPGKQSIRNILRFIKNPKDICCFLFCEAIKLRLNFVHCFIQKISLSVLIWIGDLPSANIITEFLLLECLIEEKNKYKDWLAPMKALTNSKDWQEALS